MDCSVQMAGSDQFGNIVAGIDLIRREFGVGAGGGGADAGDGEERMPPAFAITAPLVTRSDGKKLGKTEKGAIWLTADRTSPYAFYQYWINLEDADVVGFLKWFTFLGQEEIEDLAKQHESEPHLRIGQRRLASEMTTLLHGAGETQRAEAASRALFSGDVRGLDGDLIAEVFSEVPSSSHSLTDLAGDGVSLVELLPQTTLAKSKREAREFLSSGAVAVNGDKVPADHALTKDDLLHAGTILLRRGKKSWHVTQWA